MRSCHVYTGFNTSFYAGLQTRASVAFFKTTQCIVVVELHFPFYVIQKGQEVTQILELRCISKFSLAIFNFTFSTNLIRRGSVRQPLCQNQWTYLKRITIHQIFEMVCLQPFGEYIGSRLSVPSPCGHYDIAL